MSEELAPSFSAANYAHDGKVHILLAATGSVATIKIPNIVASLGSQDKFSIRIIVTESAANFLNGQSDEQPSLQQIRRMKGVEGIYHDEDEWKKPWVRGADILHIELRRWAHVLLIAPLSANSLAKMAVGMADNLLLSVVRAWDTSGTIDTKKPTPRIFVAPAMNTAMWRNPLTNRQVETLDTSWGFQPETGGGWVTVIKPMEKELACGDIGDGAMEDWRKIVRIIEEYCDA
ncbi:putative phosphopantothenoylcysteine decarboxylase [Microsporum audouinii]